jgi:hypothetical protein
VVISGASWPQVLYIHPVVAPFLRSTFGYHAAHFLGNFLFGDVSKPSCFLGEDYTVEGWRFIPTDDMLPIIDYGPYLIANGVDLNRAVLLTNLEVGSLNWTGLARFKGVEGVNTTGESLVCALRKLMSGRKIIQTFGSRLGFWATALVGTKGAFMNGVDRLCVNMTNSQQGSLWHTNCAWWKSWVYRSNTWFFICGENARDAQLYFEYLLW